MDVHGKGALLLLVACAKPAPVLPPALGNQRADVPDEKVPANCEAPARVTMRIGGTRERVTLLDCLVRERTDSEEAKEAGLTLKDRRAELVWRPAGEASHRFTIREWTDGWEWGGSVTMIGVLSAPSGDDAIVIQLNSWDTGIGSQRAVILAPRGTSWKQIEELPGDTITLQKDGRAVHLESCEFWATTEQTPDVACDATNGTVTKMTLRWDGTSLTR